MRALLANRQVRIYLGGQVFSLTGDLMLFLAMGIWVKTLTSSSALAGPTFFFLAAPSVLAPLAGLLVDRLRRRPLLVVTNLTLGVAVLPLLAVRDATDVWLIYAVMVVYGAGYLVLPSGQSALLATMLPAELLGEANSALSLVRGGLRLLAPLAGAGLFAAFGPKIVIIADAATFAVAALSLCLLNVAERRPTRDGERRQRQVLARTFRVIGTWTTAPSSRSPSTNSASSRVDWCPISRGSRSTAVIGTGSMPMALLST